MQFLYWPQTAAHSAVLYPCKIAEHSGLNWEIRHFSTDLRI